MDYYEIKRDAIWDMLDEEISKAADEAYGDGGVSLYDSIVLTEKDRSTAYRFIGDGVDALLVRLYDICRYENTADTERLRFHVPDFDDTMEEAVKTELDRYLVMFAAAAIFQQRRAALAEEYATRAQTALDKAVVLLKSRKEPNQSW